MRRVALLSGIVMALASVHSVITLLRYLRTGAYAFWVSDFGVYFSYLQQAGHGIFLFRDLFTTEPQPFGFLNLFWFVIGRLGGWLHVPIPATFEVARLVFIPVALLAAAFVFRVLLRDRRDERAALWLFAFGGGWGGWFLFAKIAAGMRLVPGVLAQPVDLWVMESTFFMSAAYSGHFLASTASIAAVLAGMYWYSQTPTFRRLALPVAVMILHAQFHTYYAPLLVAVTGVGFLSFMPTGKRFWQLFGGVLALAAAAVIGAMPYMWLSMNDLTTILRNATNQTPMPPWWIGLISYGTFVPLALIGIWRGRKERNESWRFLTAWTLVQAFFIYLPTQFQRKMTEGFLLPLAAFAAPVFLLGADRAVRAVTARFSIRLPVPLWSVTVAMACVVLFSSTQVLNFWSLIAAARTPSPLWFASDERVAIAWMRDHLPDSSIVVADVHRATTIAAFAGKRVYAGHWSETIGIDEKLTALDWLGNSARDDAARLRFLRSEHIGFVYVGSGERQAWRWQPRGGDDFREVYRNGSVAIYAVLPGFDTLDGY